MDLQKAMEHFQEEHDRMNDTLQAQITDVVSARASEIATQAWREQMMAIRGELEGSRDALRTEKKARNSAQDEIPFSRLTLLSFCVQKIVIQALRIDSEAWQWKQRTKSNKRQDKK